MMAGHRDWRIEVKKNQRKRRRQEAAKEHERLRTAEEAAQNEDPQHQEWLKQQEQLAESQREADALEHQRQEMVYLRREAQVLQEIQEKTNKQDEVQVQLPQETEEHIKLSLEYAHSAQMPTPPHLKNVSHSEPLSAPCTLFTRTNFCHYGEKLCSYDHVQPALTRVLVFENMFDHAMLHPLNEVNESELREAYEQFFYDVIPELEKHGTILNFRALRNTMPHLRGHVFVEYAEKRHALKAFMTMENRHYDGKPLKMKFSHLTNWSNAICVFHLVRKCRKFNHHCNSLHLFVNPGNKYNLPIKYMLTPGTQRLPRFLKAQSPLRSWSDVKIKRPENWRWSQSPDSDKPIKRSTSRDKSVAKQKKHNNHKKHKKSKKSKKTKKRQHSDDEDYYSDNEENIRKSHKKHKRSKI